MGTAHDGCFSLWGRYAAVHHDHYDYRVRTIRRWRPGTGARHAGSLEAGRWALEEVGQPYEVRLVSFQALKEPAHLARHPFGQIPTYEEGDLALFETGAIVMKGRGRGHLRRV
jgi:hypothetical protein